MCEQAGQPIPLNSPQSAIVLDTALALLAFICTCLSWVFHAMSLSIEVSTDPQLPQVAVTHVSTHDL